MSSDRNPSRRRVLATGAALGAVGFAGCLSDSRARFSGMIGRLRTTDDDQPSSHGAINQDPDGPHPLLADDSLHLAYDEDHLASSALSGGPGVDGIPSIDDPDFTSVDNADLAGDDPVFGVVRDGEAKAYPQSVLVWHEIVNDTLAGDPVAVTYCPLTGTAQGFERGETEFGVSGQLVNSNLLMYDRGTGTRWPQVVATGVDGPLTGRSLAEFRVTWTTWEQWATAYPDTQVLTTNTGYQRRYGDDPYGEYAPASGYYANERTMFEPLAESDEEHPKAVVIGARTTDAAIAFNKERLLDERVLTGEAGGEEFVAVAEPTLETGYLYRTDGATVEAVGNGRYRVDGEEAPAESLGLDSVLAFDAMFFAWYGFYPETTYVN